MVRMKSEKKKIIGHMYKFCTFTYSLCPHSLTDEGKNWERLSLSYDMHFIVKFQSPIKMLMLGKNVIFFI